MENKVAPEYVCMQHTPMRATQSAKELSSFKFDKATKKRLSRFAKRKRVTMTAVLEALIEKYCLTYKEEN